MSKTFEALQKAEKERSKSTKAKVFSDVDLPAKGKNIHKLKVSTWINEEYSRVKHHLHSLKIPDEIKTILFTSSKPEEGTSTVLFNFALNIANDGDPVIIIDSNLRTPVIHDFAALDKENGLSDLLTGNISLGQALKKTEIKNLEIITCGSLGANPSHLLSSDLIPKLIEKLRNRADWILFDSPPIHVYNDSCILAEKMDGVILVVQAEKTKWEVALSAKEKINKTNSRLLGAILNKKQMHIPNWLYNLI